MNFPIACNELKLSVTDLSSLMVIARHAFRGADARLVDLLDRMGPEAQVVARILLKTETSSNDTINWLANYLEQRAKNYARR